uniref:Uncharacterized protein n=1 Tax=Anguilla anguilla TaxID=7936 RepID=A0A0E9PAE8_ANGAN
MHICVCSSLILWIISFYNQYTHRDTPFMSPLKKVFFVFIMTTFIIKTFKIPSLIPLFN